MSQVSYRHEPRARIFARSFSRLQCKILGEAEISASPPTLIDDDGVCSRQERVPSFHYSFHMTVIAIEDRGRLSARSLPLHS